MDYQPTMQPGALPRAAQRAESPGADAVAPAHRAARVVLVAGDDAAALEAYRARWERLAAEALEPNVYYEPWALLPALAAFGVGCGVEIAMVQRRGDGALIGMFPLARAARFRALPVAVLRLWSHDFCFLATPLVHAAHARECLDALLDWLRESAGAPLLELGGVGADGAFAHALADALAERDAAWCALERRSRGRYVPRATSEVYLAEALRGEARRRLRAKEQKLRALGRVEYDALAPDGDVGAWAADFLALEASGWKGQEGSAMASEPRRRDFFDAIVAEAHRRGQLEMLALRLDGRTIAARCSLRAGAGAFVWKIAYDESLGRFSPGMLLELEGIRRLHAESVVRWADSCANPRSRLFGEACNQRRGIETVLVAAGSEPSRLLLALLPLAQWAARQARALRGRVAPAIVSAPAAEER